MIINDSQVSDVLLGNSSAGKHWIFNKIVDNEYLYEGVRIDNNRINEIKKAVIKSLNNFEPSNIAIFNELFSNWKSIESNTKVELVVGCPEIYDMMVRNNIIVIDIQNLDKYLNNGYAVAELLQLLITHEFVHMSINQDYSISENTTYLERLDYIMFQEGFAHAIPYIDNFIKADETTLAKYFKEACEQLEIAIIEKNPERQKQLLIDANTGDYWDKFGAISAKLYLLNNLEDTKEIYQKGPKMFHLKILNYYKSLSIKSNLF